MFSLSKSMPGFRYDPTKGQVPLTTSRPNVMHAISKKACQTGVASRLSDVGSQSLPSGEEDAQWEAQWRQYHLRRALTVVETEYSHLDRQAFERYALGGEEVKAVAEALNMSIDHVYQAKSRIARRIRRADQDPGGRRGLIDAR